MTLREIYAINSLKSKLSFRLIGSLLFIKSILNKRRNLSQLNIRSNRRFI